MRILNDKFGEPAFAHDFDNVAYHADEFDSTRGTRGLHTVKRRVEWVERQTALPVGLFERYADDMFWRVPKATNPSAPTIRLGESGETQ